MVDETRGKVVEMYIAVKPGHRGERREVAKKVSAQIERDIGKIARPKNVWVVPDMPKTRSGKIMRRVIAGISNFADVGDVSTLANPEVVDKIQEQVQSAKEARGEEPKLSEAGAGGDREFGRVRVGRLGATDAPEGSRRQARRAPGRAACSLHRQRRPSSATCRRATGIVWPSANASSAVPPNCGRSSTALLRLATYWRWTRTNPNGSQRRCELV